VEVELQVGLAGLVEDGRRVGRLEGNVLDVDLLDAEGRASGFLRGGGGSAVGGFVGHFGLQESLGSGQLNRPGTERGIMARGPGAGTPRPGAALGSAALGSAA